MIKLILITCFITNMNSSVNNHCQMAEVASYDTGEECEQNYYKIFEFNHALKSKLVKSGYSATPITYPHCVDTRGY